MVLGIHRLRHSFILYKHSLGSDKETLQWTSKLLYADKVRRIYEFFLISRGVPEYIYAKYYLIQH